MIRKGRLATKDTKKEGSRERETERKRERREKAYEHQVSDTDINRREQGEHKEHAATRGSWDMAEVGGA